jgi:hypothetical protein
LYENKYGAAGSYSIDVMGSYSSIIGPAGVSSRSIERTGVRFVAGRHKQRCSGHQPSYNTTTEPHTACYHRCSIIIIAPSSSSLHHHHHSIIAPSSSSLHHRSIIIIIAAPSSSPLNLSCNQASVLIHRVLRTSNVGIEMAHVPYRGGGPALNDVIPGRVDVYFGTMPSTLPLARAGQVRALAVTSIIRSTFAPELPTIAESGVPGYDVSAWYGLYVPARTPVEIVSKLHRDAAAALMHPQVKQRLGDIAAVAVSSTPDELVTLLKSDMALWGPIIKAAGIRGE